MLSISEQDVQRMREALVALHDDVAHFVNESGMYPAPESLAAKEQADSSKTEQLSAAYSGGNSTSGICRRPCVRGDSPTSQAGPGDGALYLRQGKS